MLQIKYFSKKKKKSLYHLIKKWYWRKTQKKIVHLNAANEHVKNHCMQYIHSMARVATVDKWDNFLNLLKLITV